MAKDAEQEPSIEEILDSIRQIISDDDEPAEKPEAGPLGNGATVNAARADDDFIPLTKKLEPSSQAMQVDLKESVILPDPEPMADIGFGPESDPEPEPQISMTPPPRRPDPPPLRMPEPDVENLLTQRAEAATMESFKDLARRAAIERVGTVSIEDVVREELRPLLKTWLDMYLPELVERLVQKEVERISQHVMGD